MFRATEVVRGNKEKPVHTGLYLVRKGMRLDGAALSFFTAICIYQYSVFKYLFKAPSIIFS